MRKTTVVIVTFAAVLAAGLFGCSSNDTKNKTSNTSNLDSAAGLTWSAPTGWKEGPPQQMRIKTYLISATQGDPEGAECGIFFFPGGLGGGKEANLQRWVGQFEQPDGRNSADLAAISEMESNGLKVTTIELSGIYKQASGPMMEVKERKPGFRLMGAIVECPKGLVFFKLVGPEKTVVGAANDFTEMLKGVKAAGGQT